jgi:hypothetical protein
MVPDKVRVIRLVTKVLDIDFLHFMCASHSVNSQSHTGHQSRYKQSTQTTIKNVYMYCSALSSCRHRLLCCECVPGCNAWSVDAQMQLNAAMYPVPCVLCIRQRRPSLAFQFLRDLWKPIELEHQPPDRGWDNKYSHFGPAGGSAKPQRKKEKPAKKAGGCHHCAKKRPRRSSP